MLTWWSPSDVTYRRARATAVAERRTRVAAAEPAPVAPDRGRRAVSHRRGPVRRAASSPASIRSTGLQSVQPSVVRMRTRWKRTSRLVECRCRDRRWPPAGPLPRCRSSPATARTRRELEAWTSYASWLSPSAGGVTRQVSRSGSGSSGEHPAGDLGPQVGHPHRRACLERRARRCHRVNLHR